MEGTHSPEVHLRLRRLNALLDDLPCLRKENSKRKILHGMRPATGKKMPELWCRGASGREVLLGVRDKNDLKIESEYLV